MNDALIVSASSIPREIELFSLTTRNLITDLDTSRLPDLDAVEVSFPMAKPGHDYACTRACIAADMAKLAVESILLLFKEVKLARRLHRIGFPDNPEVLADLIDTTQAVRKRVHYMRNSDPRKEVFSQLVDEYLKTLAFTGSVIDTTFNDEERAMKVTKAATYAVSAMKIATLAESAVHPKGVDLAYVQKTMIDSALKLLSEFALVGTAEVTSAA